MSSKGLLDAMLEDTKKQGEREAEDRRRETASAQPEEQPEPQEWPSDTEQLLELSRKDLHALLAAISPDDLLCVVAEGSEALGHRILGELDEESVKWLKGNLTVWDPATEGLKQASRAAVLKVAHRLLAEGKITRPESPERLEQDQDTEAQASQGELLEMLVQLVTLAHVNGHEALSDLADEAPSPLLQLGLAHIVEKGNDGLEEVLIERQRALEAALRAELELIRTALVSIGRGDTPQAFIDRALALSKKG